MYLAKLFELSMHAGDGSPYVSRSQRPIDHFHWDASVDGFVAVAAQHIARETGGADRDKAPKVAGKEQSLVGTYHQHFQCILDQGNRISVVFVFVVVVVALSTVVTGCCFLR